ncbi:ParB/RepB/Spo0J family partition protein [Deinococcus ruber]|uniref:Chromosome partitioning protein ParB n=1 Tax=Deinococcus ruber TaxID=1848197 RepID=A0A918C246_9DEIO|nr:ParB/RepB/Spo0J family partition protein [Deinococcus ruber]GGR03007.1 chromosome partitioning protein ParB [Deinococcus ruber]
MSNRFAKPSGSSGTLSSILNRSVELAAGKGSLLHTALDEQLKAQSGEHVFLPIRQLVPNPGQPRRYFSPDSLEQLATSIRERGVLQPLMVRPLPREQYEIVFGERRWRAASIAGLEVVPVLIRTLSDSEVKFIAAVENLQREDLNRFDEVQFKLHLVAELLGVSEEQARAQLKQLRTQADDEGTVDRRTRVAALFEQLGNESWVSFVTNGLPVLNLPAFLVEPLRAGQLAYSKALLIARAPDMHQQVLLEKTVNNNLSLTELRQELQTLSTPATPQTADVVRRLLTPKRLQQLQQQNPKKHQRVQSLLTELRTLIDEPAASSE